ncbi:hypothetical protein PT974_07791 [Cladobotryum mycophilum]|uniref:Uncharacterized protein n=1 Tax=Cladobotryum mycophilum TaxID=491253 RepID=A0ABR0SIT8_9HYPO
MDPWLSPGPNPRFLHIYYSNGRDKLQVMDHDKSTVLYTVHRKREGENTQVVVVGKVSFHRVSSAIDVDVPDKNLSMKKAGWPSSSYRVTGPDLAWKWEQDGIVTSSLRLVDERRGAGNGKVLARFEFASWSRKKQGSMSVYGEAVRGRDVLDRVVVSGLAMVEEQRRNGSAGAGAGAEAGE